MGKKPLWADVPYVQAQWGSCGGQSLCCQPFAWWQFLPAGFHLDTCYHAEGGPQCPICSAHTEVGENSPGSDCTCVQVPRLGEEARPHSGLPASLGHNPEPEHLQFSFTLGRDSQAGMAPPWELGSLWPVTFGKCQECPIGLHPPSG